MVVLWSLEVTPWVFRSSVAGGSSLHTQLPPRVCPEPLVVPWLQESTAYCGIVAEQGLFPVWLSVGGEDFSKVDGSFWMSTPSILLSAFDLSLFCFSSVQESESEAKADGETASDSESRVEAATLPPSADDTPEVLNRALSNLSSR